MVIHWRRLRATSALFYLSILRITVLFSLKALVSLTQCSLLLQNS